MDAVTERKEVELCVGIVGNIAMPASVSRLQLDRYSRPTGVETWTIRFAANSSLRFTASIYWTRAIGYIFVGWFRGSTLISKFRAEFETIAALTGFAASAQEWLLSVIRSAEGSQSDRLRGRQNSLRLCV